MVKHYFTLGILAICLLGACKGDKKEPAKKEKITNEVKETPKPKAKVKKADSDKGNGITSTRKGYWSAMNESVNFTDDQFDKLQALEKERRKALSEAKEGGNAAINKEYTAKKKELLGIKLFRSYREFDKKWKNRNK
ncbi:MAG: hypothetical protein HKO66_13780 [Saprospiraceae bacterium]|nr:hypothetical protein [Saprospiraceae bacterium]